MRISDWSSDVCSSDLTNPTQKEEPMFTARTRRALAGAAGVAVAALALAGCASSNPLEDDNAAGGETGGDDTTIVVGSQAYYSNEINAEIYAQALENAGCRSETRRVGQGWVSACQSLVRAEN